MYVRRYNKKAVTASAAAFLGLDTWRGNPRVARKSIPENRLPARPRQRARRSRRLPQRLASVQRITAGFGFIGIDFLANGRVLHLPKRLAPVLHATVQVGFAGVAGLDGTRTATDYEQQQNGHETEKQFH